MICEVEVDAETGSLNVDRLYAVDDVGVVVNPLTLAGQLHGSIAQGLGEATVEQILYDRKSGAASHRFVYGLRHAARRYDAGHHF